MKKLARPTAVILVFIMLFSLVLSGCGGSDEPTQTTAPDKTSASHTLTAESDGTWTVLVYLCGSDLESEDGAATDDLFEMMDAENSENITVVIQSGGAAEWQNTLMESGQLGRYLLEDNDFTELAVLPDAGMDSPDTLQDFLSFGIENYPADHVGLILWNHGGGSVSGVCFDEASNFESLSLRALDTALDNALKGTDLRFEFIGFDACLMATLETAAILAPYANYMFASQELEPGSGWDYTALLNFLVEYPGADGAALGAVQCESYFAVASGEANGSNCTFSVTDLSKLEPLIAALDETSAELLASGDSKNIIRTARMAENFGGNNRSEGYTNMVDLASLLQGVSDIAPSGEKAVSALADAVVCNVADEQHKSAGGLSLYYPLSLEGSMELGIFRDICPSPNYAALVDQLAGEIEQNTQTASDSSLGTQQEELDTIPVTDVYLDEDGILTVELADSEDFYFASCTLWWILYLDDEGEEYVDIYLGEDDDVLYNDDYTVIQDNFDGSWVFLEDELLPIELVDVYDTRTVFTCTVLLNGEETNLKIVYDWDRGEFYVPGTWSGIDSETGMADRDATPLKEGDQLEIVYYFLDENGDVDWFCSDPVVYNGSLELYYDYLPTGEYDYSMNLYDIYGNYWSTDYVTFGVDDDGSVYYYD